MLKPLLFLTALMLLLAACTTVEPQGEQNMPKETASDEMTEFVTKQGGTEQPFKNEYWDHHEPGIYLDANTNVPLFSSLDKYDSGTGWPAFTKTIDGAPVDQAKDLSHGMVRTEVKTNESHLGHLFQDGPDGGDRYCINSAALRFVHYKDLDKEGFSQYKKDFPYQEAALAGGCFWGVEKLLEEQEGVLNAESGYMGGWVKNPSYTQVSLGVTGHAETVHIIFDPNIITYEELLDIFWRLHNPTTKNRQGPDIGPQYRSVIFFYSEEQRQIAENSKAAFDAKGVFEDPAVTEIISAEEHPFYPAEDYHQDYYANNQGKVCHELRDE